MLQFEQMRALGWDPLLCDTLCPTMMAVCRAAYPRTRATSCEASM
jgi:hypothetical protein